MKKSLAKSRSGLCCVVHGSFRRHWDEILVAIQVFAAAGIEVIAPKHAAITSFRNGFAFLEGESYKDPRLIELEYLHHLKHIGRNGFSYFVNPGGRIGISTSYELGIAQLTNVPCFFSARPVDHPVYTHRNSIWPAQDLADYVLSHGALPEPRVKRDEKIIHQLWEDLMVPGSVVATGAIIEHDNPRRREKEVLLVRTHKWGGRWSVIGGKIRRHERLDEALAREIREESGLKSKIGQHLVTFDQIKHSGYYQTGTQHIFVDYVSQVSSKRVRLNEEAQDFTWLPARIALRDLDIEPNARHTLELYTQTTS